MNRIAFFALVVAFTLPSAACGKKVAAGPVPAAVSVQKPMLPAVPKRQEVEDQLQVHFEKVFFAYDSSRIDTNGRNALMAAAKLMQANPTLTVEVQGHCDDRGSVAYNRTLGNNRAQAVREVLIAGGVAPTRIHTTSYGKDRPAVTGNGEAAWAANRRGELVPSWQPSVAVAD